jgi:hypothetical protein
LLGLDAIILEISACRADTASSRLKEKVNWPADQT